LKDLENISRKIEQMSREMQMGFQHMELRLNAVTEKVSMLAVPQNPRLGFRQPYATGQYYDISDARQNHEDHIYFLAKINKYNDDKYDDII
jgi:hypothetical protein